MIDGKYIDVNDVLSHGLDINVIKGKREIGKSYGNLIRANARRFRNHEAMVWLRFTAEEAEGLAGEFGSGKWLEIWRHFDQTAENYRRGADGRILWRPHKCADWLPLIRYAGLSEWHKLRDRDDPQEQFLLFDEYIVPDSKFRRYTAGNPAENLLDLWVSLRRGGGKMPVLLMGNPELGRDWFLPSVGVHDEETPERVRVYDMHGKIIERANDPAGRFNTSKCAVFWTTNPGGQSSGGDDSGRSACVPDGLQRARGGHEMPYCQFDFGGGHVSLWYTRDGALIVDTTNTPDHVVKLFPDGDPRTVIFSQGLRRRCSYLRQCYLSGRVYFANYDAFLRFGDVIKKIL